MHEHWLHSKKERSPGTSNEAHRSLVIRSQPARENGAIGGDKVVGAMAEAVSYLYSTPTIAMRVPQEPCTRTEGLRDIVRFCLRSRRFQAGRAGLIHAVRGFSPAAWCIPRMRLPDGNLSQDAAARPGGPSVVCLAPDALARRASMRVRSGPTPSAITAK